LIRGALEFGDQKMKNFLFLFVVCAFGAVGAVGQVNGGAVFSSQPMVFTLPDHPAYASATGMSAEHNIMERSGSSYAQGERPVWEVMQLMPGIPLGDSARALRQEHATAKKAVIVWKN